MNPYQIVIDNPQLVAQIADDIGQSGLFGKITKQQARIFAIESMVRGIPTLALAERYHVIHDKLSLKADATLAQFNQIGGTHKILKRTEDEVGIRLSFNGEESTFKIKWTDAIKEPFPYEGKEADIVAMLTKEGGPDDDLELKTKYATPHSRKQMLWARLITDAVRAVAPQVIFGRYSPEEVSDFTGKESPAEMADRVLAAAEASTDKDKTEPEAKPDDDSDDAPSLCTAKQRDDIRRLFAQIGKEDAIGRIIQKKGFERLDDMTEEAAASLIEGLKKKVKEKGEPAEPTEESVSRKLTEEESEELKTMIRELSQVAEFKGIGKRIKEKIKGDGLNKFTDLTLSEGRKLKAAIETRKMEAFFSAAITGDDIPF